MCSCGLYASCKFVTFTRSIAAGSKSKQVLTLVSDSRSNPSWAFDSRLPRVDGIWWQRMFDI